MSIRILIDMNISPQWVKSFSKFGIEAVHWSSVGEQSATDQEIADWARKNQHIIFTHDLDFGTMLALSQDHGPSIIQVRGQNILPDSLQDTLINVIQKYEAELLRGALLVIDETRSRVKLLPID